MTILSRMGAFMVGTALGAVQSLYFLHTDVKIVDSAMAKKIQSISQQVEKNEQQAAMRLSALQQAAASSQ